jgi:uncharacterized protein YukJ
MAKRKKPVPTHSEVGHKVDIDELLSRFPVTGRDRLWSSAPVARKAFGAAHRVFEKHFKGQIKLTKNV